MVWLLIEVYFLVQISGFSLADGCRADGTSTAWVSSHLSTVERGYLKGFRCVTVPFLSYFDIQLYRLEERTYGLQQCCCLNKVKHLLFDGARRTLDASSRRSRGCVVTADSSGPVPPHRSRLSFSLLLFKDGPSPRRTLLTRPHGGASLAKVNARVRRLVRTSSRLPRVCRLE